MVALSGHIYFSDEDMGRADVDGSNAIPGFVDLTPSGSSRAAAIYASGQGSALR